MAWGDVSVTSPFPTALVSRVAVAPLRAVAAETLETYKVSNGAGRYERGYGRNQARLAGAASGYGGGGTFLHPLHGGSRRRRGGKTPAPRRRGVPRVFQPRAVSRRPAVPARRRSRCLLRRFSGGARRAFRSLLAPWCPPLPVFDLGRAKRSLPSPSAVSAGGGSCFPLWGGRRSASRPPPQLLSLFLLFLAVGAAVLFLLAANATAVLNLDKVKTVEKSAVKVVSGGVRGASVRVLAGGMLSVWVRRGVLVLPPLRWGVPPPLLHLLPLPGGHGRWSFVVGVGVKVDVGGWGWLPLAVLPVLQQHCRLPCLWIPPHLVTATPGRSVPLPPAERAARAAAFLTRARPRAGALVARETIFVSGVNGGAPAQRLRGVLADLTGVHVHSIVDVRRIGAATAVTLTATGVPTFTAALGVGAAAGVFTLLPGANPWSPAFLGPRRRAHLTSATAAAEAVSSCRRRHANQVAEVATRAAMPPFLRASLAAHDKADLAAHAGAGGVAAVSSAAARDGSSAAVAVATAGAAANLAGGGAAASAAAHPAAVAPPPGHVSEPGAAGADVSALEAAVAKTAATPGTFAELAAAAAASAAISVGGGAAASTAAHPPAISPPNGHVGGAFPAIGAAVAPATANTGGSVGSAAAFDAAAAAISSGGGHTTTPAAPPALASPSPRQRAATGAPDAGVDALAADWAMKSSSDAAPAAGALPAAAASPPAPAPSAAGPPPAGNAPAAATPPPAATPPTTGGPAGGSPAKKARRRRSGRRAGASPTSAVPAEASFGMDVDDALAVAPVAAGQGEPASAPPPAAGVAPPPAPLGFAPLPPAATTAPAAEGAPVAAAAVLPTPTAGSSACRDRAAAATRARRGPLAGGCPDVANRRTRTTLAGLARTLAAAGGSLLRGGASLPPPAARAAAARGAASAAPPPPVPAAVAGAAAAPLPPPLLAGGHAPGPAGGLAAAPPTGPPTGTPPVAAPCHRLRRLRRPPPRPLPPRRLRRRPRPPPSAPQHRGGRLTWVPRAVMNDDARGSGATDGAGTSNPAPSVAAALPPASTPKSGDVWGAAGGTPSGARVGGAAGGGGVATGTPDTSDDVLKVSDNAGDSPPPRRLLSHAARAAAVLDGDFVAALADRNAGVWRPSARGAAATDKRGGGRAAAPSQRVTGAQRGALRQAATGRLSAAARSLVAEEAAPQTKADWAKAQTLFPPASPTLATPASVEAAFPAELAEAAAFGARRNIPPPVNRNDLAAVVRAAPRGKASGPSGLRVEHLGVLDAGGQDTLEGVLVLLAGPAGAARMPACASGALAATDLLLLRKPGGVQADGLPRLPPIGMSEVLRKLEATALARAVRSPAAALFAPLQLGVGVSRACERILPEMSAHLTAHPTHALVQLDFRNAFNLVSRVAAAAVLAAAFPELAPYLQWLYCGASGGAAPPVYGWAGGGARTWAGRRT
ncbi:hypothetical protein BU14_0052s0036 [Porphyra umbilicalis]|uniref:Reverse transcriptase domain-containing protein n=1 Tax=Porphyra umbilicalis TaxID=2786 RepID=A0A1X6PHS4_PORUM|nr:hypothetical protein BU14_0052s0036 [Porphyra umbilicalis]|eukprot:OSX80420.1 hypothetical protein BU14_0052s0036 [Porphyra umbilicalis]